MLSTSCLTAHYDIIHISALWAMASQFTIWLEKLVGIIFGELLDVAACTCTYVHVQPIWQILVW